VDSTPWEDGDGAGRDIVEDETSTVLGKHTRAEGAIDGNVDFSGTGMGVGGVQTTGTQVAVSWRFLGKSGGGGLKLKGGIHTHRHTVANKGGEVGGIGLGDRASCTFGTADASQEVEDELIEKNEGE
jgi:hypothetical protein